MTQKRDEHFFVYILQCADGSYYTGYTRNMKKRLQEHQAGIGSAYTKYRLPIRLVYCKQYKYYENALKAEKRLKRLTRERKETLIAIYQKGSPRCFAPRNKPRGNQYYD